MSVLMHSFEQLWFEYEPVLNGVAAEMGSKGHKYGSDASDFRQEFVVWMMDNERRLSEKREELGPDEFGKYLRACLRGESMDYLVDIRAQAGGQDRASAYWYSIAELEVLLPKVFNEDAWHEPPQSDGGSSRSAGDPAIGGNWIATLADVSQGVAKLEAEDREILHAFHRDGWMNKELAAYYQISESLMSYRHGRAVKRLLRILGDEKPKHMRPDTPHDPWRGRHSISNAHARAITNNNYESE